MSFKSFNIISRIRDVTSAQIVHLVGQAPVASFPINDLLWTTSSSGGETSQSSGLYRLSVGGDATNNAQMSSIGSAVYVPGTVNEFIAGIKCSSSSSSSSSSSKRFGAFTSTKGLFFQLSGSVLSCVTRKNSVDTSYTSFNGDVDHPVTDDKFNNYTISYSANGVVFMQNNKLIHWLDADELQNIDTLNLPLKFEISNEQSGSPHSLLINEAAIVRLGSIFTKPLFYTMPLTGNVTRTLSFIPGTLHRVLVTLAGSAGDGNQPVLTLCNNTGSSGQIISTINTKDVAGTLEFNIDFVALSVSSTGNIGGVTIMFS